MLDDNTYEQMQRLIISDEFVVMFRIQDTCVAKSELEIPISATNLCSALSIWEDGVGGGDGWEEEERGLLAASVGL